MNPGRPQSERYGADYVCSVHETNSTSELRHLIFFNLQTSPASKHPPLRLRLTAPNEAGFLLEKVPVNSLKEIYGVLEVSSGNMITRFLVDR